MKSRKKLAYILALGLVLLGITVYAATVTILAVGTMPYSELINGPATVTARHNLLPAGEVGSWHYHPGPSINVVKQGALTLEDGCGRVDVFTAGQAFETLADRVHRASNLGTQLVEEYNTFIYPEGQPMTVTLPERKCGPPRSVRECRGGGWMDFTHPRSFSSQGDCIQFIYKND